MQPSMVDLNTLRDSFAKAEAKAKRLRLQADAATKEATELETAIRVIERLDGAAEAPSTTQVGGNGAIILQYVGEGEPAGKSPKEVHEMVSIMEGDIGADLVRTQLWRMAKRGILQSKDGRYWKPKKEEAPDAEASEASKTTGPADGSQGGATHLHPEGSIPSGSTLVQAFEGDLDDDVPF